MASSTEHYPLRRLIATIMVTLIGSAVFFISFLVAPLFILIAFYAWMSFSDRAKRNRMAKANGQPAEPERISGTPGIQVSASERLGAR